MAVVVGTHCGDELNGTDDADDIDGLGGDDQIFAGDGNDRVLGGDGDDEISGQAGNDFLEGGLGSDVLLGGDGFDFASFADRSDTGFTFFMSGALTAQAKICGEIDTLISIDAVVGSRLADTYNADAAFVGDDGSPFNQFEGLEGDDEIFGNGDTLISYTRATGGVIVDFVQGSAQGIAGDAGVGVDSFSGVSSVNGSQFDDILLGSDSDAFENFRGLAGNDFIDGAGGVDDRADFSNSPNGVIVDLAENLAQDGFGTVDFLFNIEDVRGSSQADTLAGDAADNTFRGLAGNDQLIGRDGFDTADYRADATAGISVELSATATVATLSVDEGAEVSGPSIGFDEGGVGTDTLVGVERVLGSRFNDIFIADLAFDNGSASDSAARRQFNAFRGGDGDDDITGNGVTRLEYIDATSGVTVSLALGQGQATDMHVNAAIGIDTFTGVFEVRGSRHNDILTGSDLNPEAGFESFIGEDGDDAIDGGGGLDRLSYSTSPGGVVVDLTAGTAEDGFGATDTFSGIEGVRGSFFDDRLSGDVGDNFFESLQGDDVINGRGGDDLASYAGLSRAVDVNLALRVADKGGDGRDTLISIEDVAGSIFGDSIVGSTSSNTLSGDAGADRIVGLTGNDILNGGSGDDVLFGNSGADTLNGGDGADRLNGGFGVDTMAGGAGDDIYFVDESSDVVIEGADEGFDKVVIQQGTGFFGAVANVEVYILDFSAGTTGFLNGLDNFNDTLIGGDSHDSLNGFSGDDLLLGGNGDDILQGGEGNDLLRGEAGNDTLSAGAGDDILLGGAGNDALIGISGFNRLNGQAGDDTLIGGNGADRLNGGLGDDVMFANGNGEDVNLSDGATDRFLIAANSGIDTIFGFIDGEDQIDFRGINDQTGRFPSFAAVAQTISEVNGNATITISTNDIITLVGVPASALDASDFILANVG